MSPPALVVAFFRNGYGAPVLYVQQLVTQSVGFFMIALLVLTREERFPLRRTWGLGHCSRSRFPGTATALAQDAPFVAAGTRVSVQV